MKNLIYLIFLLIVVSSCSTKEFDAKAEIGTEKFKLNYINGNKYCEGNYSTYKKKRKVSKEKIGVWKYYYLNGNPKTIDEYEENELINSIEFNDLGNIQYSFNATKNTITHKYYYENGKINTEKIIETVTEEEYYGEDFETTSKEYVTIKTYYRNGQLKGLKKIEDDVLIGKVKIWDDKGNLILERDKIE